MSKHFVMPDVQCKPNTSNLHLLWASEYLIQKKPDVVVCLGDFADMESLSSYDIGKKSFEGRRYTKDIEAAREAMNVFMQPIWREQNRLIRNKEKQWNPRLVMLLGNHENRINRAVENDPKLENLMEVSDLAYESFGWEVVPYLQPITIDGISYSHYFVSGVMGRPVTSARMLLTKHHMSCVAGHQQGRDIAYGKRADGKSITGLISGSYYLHDEGYLNYQSNNCWRGCWLLNEVNDGAFDELPLSISYLEKNYLKRYSK